MEYKAPDSCTSRGLEKKEATKFISEEQYAEVEVRLKAAIAKSAHERFASPSFPPELRLQVMKAGVLHGTTWWHVRPDDTVDDIWNAAFSSLLPPELWNSKRERFNLDWLDAKTRRSLANTAKQAFFETAIFKYEAAFRDPAWVDDVASFKIPAPLASIGARIHHLDVAIRVKLNSFALPENGYHARMAFRCMKSLKLHFPNLKTCVLTLDVHFRLNSRFDSLHASPFAQFDERLLTTVTACPHTDDREIKTVHDEITKLLEEFVEFGPGKTRFVRVRFRSIPHEHSMQEDQQAREYFTYGPLVKVQRFDGDEASIGAQLLGAAYRLKRTGPRLLSQERFP